MKKLVLVALIIVSGLSVVKAQQSCGPNPLYNDSLPGVYPHNLPPLVYGQPYNTTITVKTMGDTIISGNNYHVQGVKILDVVGEPPGFHIVPNYTSLDSAMWQNNYQNNIWYPTQGCFTIWADTAAVNAEINGGPNGDGVFPLNIYYDYLFRGDVVPSTYVWASTIGLPPYGSTFELYSVIGTGTACNYDLYYQGNATYYAGLPATSGQYQLDLNSPNLNCGWTVIGNCGWAGFDTNYGFGNATLNFTYASNTTGATRYCNIIIGDQEYYITQITDTCNVVMNIDSTFFGPLEGTAYITVTAADSCYWAVINRSFVCDWVDINPTSGQGSGVVELTYSENTTNSNRSCELNFNGQTINITQQSTVGINENTLNSRIKIYPNPANDFVTIQNPDINGKTTLSIYTVAGQLLQQTPLTTTSQQVNTAALANGVYVFTVQNDAGITARKKVVISR